MNQNVLQYIRRCSIRRIWYPLFLLVLVIVFSFFLPLFQQINPNRLTLGLPKAIQTAYKAGSQYVLVPGKMTLYYTGCDNIVDGTCKGHYYYNLNQQTNTITFCCVQSNMGRSAEPELKVTNFYGRIVPLGSSQNLLAEELAKQTGWSTKKISDLTDNCMISKLDYVTWYQILLYILMAFCLMTSLYMVLHHIAVICYPRYSPACRNLKKYGEPEEIIKEVDRQLAEECYVQTKDMALLADYLIEFSEDISVIVPLKNILWVYEHATLKQSSSFKPLSYTLHIVMEDGDVHIFNNKVKEDIDVIIAELSLRYPNFFYGYSNEHYQIVKHILSDSK